MVDQKEAYSEEHSLVGPERTLVSQP